MACFASSGTHDTAFGADGWLEYITSPPTISLSPCTVSQFNPVFPVLATTLSALPDHGPYTQTGRLVSSRIRTVFMNPGGIRISGNT